MAKQERARPSQSGRRYLSFCASLAQWSSVCMLPSSGAWALSAKEPKRVFAASADTAAMATWPSPMPPNSSGMCGSHRPHSWAVTRMWITCFTSTARSPSWAAISASAGRTISSQN